MNPFSSTHRTYKNTGQRVGVIDGRAYEVSGIFVGRANRNPPLPSSPGRDWNTKRRPSSGRDWNTKRQPDKSRSNKTSTWLNKRELTRKTRLLKYKWYAVEGKVKNSFQKGMRWFKRTSNRIVHGF